MNAAAALNLAAVAAVILLVLATAVAALAVRRGLLRRGGGTVECGLRRTGGTWRRGVAAYGATELRWYGAVGVMLTPEEVLSRRTLAVTARRTPEGAEEAQLGPGVVVVKCGGGPGPGVVELAMGESALTGFLAWVESAPPSSYPMVM